MLRRPNPSDVAEQLGRQLKSDFPTIVVPQNEVPSSLVKKLTFSPDICLSRGGELIFVNLLSAGEIPAWIRRAKKHTTKNLKVLLLATATKQKSSIEIAGDVAADASKLAFGLAAETADGFVLVFPPDFRASKPIRSVTEVGHIPSWLFEKAANGTSLSSSLKQVLKEFQSRYARATSKHEISYNGECRILTELADSIAELDPRLFFPVERLQSLRDFERVGANLPARDHFFHTFNNFFLGLVVLDGLFSNRSRSDFPDRLIAHRRNLSELNLWESLWFLTSLFHDPGYIPENFWSLFSYGHGLPHDPSADQSIPREVRQRIENAWDTDWLRARRELQLIYRELTRASREIRRLIAAPTIFDRATRLAYFEKNREGHSLLSGLYLINRCLSDQTAPHRHFNRATAIRACDIACLSMLFHDQDCRETMAKADVKPLPFHCLPYAAVLMFVDALQDDRRDVRTSRFRARGVLDSLQVDAQNGLVSARVMLANVALERWPSKIAEYHSVTNWINSRSETKFIIDYVR
jgi:hypothetical protein